MIASSEAGDLLAVESFAEEHDREEHGRGGEEADECSDDGEVTVERGPQEQAVGGHVEGTCDDGDTEYLRSGCTWSGDDGGDDENGHRRCAGGHEWNRSGVIGRLGDEREECAEPRPAPMPSSEGRFDVSVMRMSPPATSQIATGATASPATASALGRSPSETPTATGTIAATTALSGLTSRLGPSASP